MDVVLLELEALLVVVHVLVIDVLLVVDEDVLVLVVEVLPL